MSSSHDPKGDRRHTAKQQQEQPDVTRTPQPINGKSVTPTYAPRTRTLALLDQITNWDHGYMKWRRSTLEPSLHLTWTWTLGKHAGCYVYVRVDSWQWEYGLELLSQKVFEVDEGHRTPTPDKRGSAHYSS